jgi:hypothetical protein
MDHNGGVDTFAGSERTSLVIADTSSCGEKYQLAAGDHLEIAVFGPLNECGPGGVPNCPGEVGNGHIGVFRTEVLPSTEDHTCPEPALSSIRRQNASN